MLNLGRKLGELKKNLFPKDTEEELDYLLISKYIEYTQSRNDIPKIGWDYFLDSCVDGYVFVNAGRGSGKTNNIIEKIIKSDDKYVAYFCGSINQIFGFIDKLVETSSTYGITPRVDYNTTKVHLDGRTVEVHSFYDPNLEYRLKGVSIYESSCYIENDNDYLESLYMYIRDLDLPLIFDSIYLVGGHINPKSYLKIKSREHRYVDRIKI